MTRWAYYCDTGYYAGYYYAPTLPQLIWVIISHRFGHWRRGDGWVD